MHTAHLRKVGGSIMLAVPPSMLELLHLKVGNSVAMEIKRGRLIVEPTIAPHYSLDELLAQCDESAELPKDELWVRSDFVGKELL